ncbi:MAG: type I restriction-modification system subunit M N-terminal domain-containing protein [Pseudoxanthomonas suwonensis]|nr:type I restriction-modification system subunit M N-terminal domain-containing protein [Pseudoxanthomonas suwonensis]
MRVFEQAFRNIDDVLRKDAGCTSELDYTEQSSWLLFLKYLDALEQERAMAAELEGRKYDWLLKKKIPLGQLGRAQGPRRSHRPQPGHDRR